VDFDLSFKISDSDMLSITVKRPSENLRY